MRSVLPVVLAGLLCGVGPVDATAQRFDLVWPDGWAFIEQPFSNHNGGRDCRRSSDGQSTTEIYIVSYFRGRIPKIVP